MGKNIMNKVEHIIQGEMLEQDVRDMLAQQRDEQVISLQLQNLYEQEQLFIQIVGQFFKELTKLNELSIKIAKNTIFESIVYKNLIDSLIGKQLHLCKLSIYVDDLCQIGEQGIFFLCQGIKQMKDITDLNLLFHSKNYIMNKGLMHIGDCITQLPALKVLGLTIGILNKVQDEGIIYFSNKLKYLTQLTSLDLNFDNRRYSEQGIISLSEALSDLMNLESLILTIYCGVGYINGATNLAKSIGYLINLKVLHLYFSQRRDFSTNITLEFSNNFKNLVHLEDLKIEGLHSLFDYEGIIAYSNSIENFPNLQILEVAIDSVNNRGQEIAINYGRTLKTLTNLSDLTLSIQNDCNIGIEGMTALSYSIKQMTKLRVLNILIKNSNKIGCEGAQSLGDALGFLNQLTKLYLFISDGNDICSEGAQSIAEGLKQLTNLTELDIQLCKNNIKSKGIYYIANSLKFLNNLNDLKLNFRENISNNGALAIGEGLSELTHLKKLHLTLGDIRDLQRDAMNGIPLGLKNLVNLQSLTLSFSESFNGGQINLSDLSKIFIYLIHLTEFDLSVYQEDGVQQQTYVDLGNALGYLINLTDFSLSLRGNNLESQGFSGIADGIKQLVKIKSMTLQFVNSHVDENSAKKIVEIFQNLKQLRRLDLWMYSNDNYIVEQIGNGFKYLQNLNSLHLYIHIENQNQGAKSLGNGLQYLQNLKELNINLNFSFDFNQEIYQICQGFKHLKKLEQLKGYLNNNNGETLDVLDAITLLPNLQDVQIRVGRFKYGNNEQNNSFEEQNQNQMIEELTQDESSLQDYKSMTTLKINIQQLNIPFQTKLLEFLKQIKKFSNLNLISLEFSREVFFGRKESQIFCRGLQKLEKLQDLSLIVEQKNKFDTYSAIEIGNALKQVQNLEIFTLKIGQFNIIHSQGASYLAEGIKHLINLIELRVQFDGCTILTQGAISLGNCIGQLINLKLLTFEIGNDSIGEEGAISIGRALRNLNKLSILRIKFGENNSIGKSGACAIGEGLQYLTNITYLELIICPKNNIQSEGVDGLCKGFSSLSDLSIFCLQIHQQNNVKSHSIKQISNSLKVLESLQFFELMICISEITSDYEIEVAQLLNLVQVQELHIKYIQQGDIVVSQIAPDKKQNILNFEFKIFFDEDNQQAEKYINSFIPLQSIGQIDSIKKLKISTSYVLNLGNEGASLLGKSLTPLVNLLELKIYFDYNHIGSGIVQIGKSLSQFKCLQTLLCKIHSGNDILSYDIQKFGEYIGQIQTLTCLQISLAKQNDITIHNLVTVLRSIAIIKSLRFLKISQNIDISTIAKYRLLKAVVKKNKRLVMFNIQNTLEDIDYY